jgi:hypothetical protein
LAACAWLLLRRPCAASFAGRLVQSAGLIALAGALASLVQLTAAALERFAGGFSLAFLGALPVAWWVLTGGWTVQQVFEATARALSGHRHSTFVDNAPYYLVLTAAQTLLVAALLARRGPRPYARDPRVWIAFLLAFANSLAGVPWPWWST